MPQYAPDQIYTAARQLLPELSPALRGQVEALLARAVQGEDTSLALLDLLSADKTLRQRLRSLLSSEAEERTLAGGYSPLPGPIHTTPGEIYRCPHQGCGYRYVIGEAGEQPPRCPQHGTELVREE